LIDIDILKKYNLKYQCLLVYFEEGREFRVRCQRVYREGKEEENYIFLGR